MSSKYALFITKFRWFVVVFWLAVTVAAVLFLPNLGTVVSHQSMNFIPDSSQVIKAQKLLEQVNPQSKAKTTAVIALHNQSGLTQQDQDYFKRILTQIDSHKDTYGVSALTDAYNVDSSVSSAFRSTDHTTEIAVAGFPQPLEKDVTIQAVASLHQAFVNLPHNTSIYFTGEAPIQQDDISISHDGAKKTTWVTVILVLVILFVVLRSLMAPLLTLISIGISFVVTSGIVAWLAEHGLPSSTFTQTFLISVIFGAGTDYCIIMLMRFREELTKDPDKLTALSKTLAAISKTTLFSGSTVLVSFAILYFAHFGLYRSAVGVSVGVAVTLIACLTFVPAIMSIFGTYLFWPRRPVKGESHSASKIWSWTANKAIRAPWRMIALLILILLPIALQFTDKRTFDPMLDIPNAPSVKGFHVVADAFGPGNVLPMNIVLQTTDNLRSSEGLAAIQSISSSVAALDSVQQISSATQPLGKPIPDFQLSQQNNTAASGLNDIYNGLDQLAGKLQDTSTQTAQIPVEGKKLSQGAAQVTDGIQQAADGAKQIADNTAKLQAGAQQVASGSSGISSSLHKMEGSFTQTKTGAEQLTKGLQQTQTGIENINSGESKLSESEKQLSQAADQLANAIAAWAKAHPDTTQDPSWQQIAGLASSLQQGTSQAAAASQQLAAGVNKLNTSIPQLVQSAGQLSSAIGQAQSGTSKLAQGADQLNEGASQLSSGTAALAGGTSKFAAGMAPLHTGSEQITQGIQTFSSSLEPLSGGLQQAGQGASKLQDGVKQVQTYLKGTSASEQTGNPGFYIPDSVITSNADLKKSMDAFISPDGHTAKFTVILTSNPYSIEAIDAVPKIEESAQYALLHSELHNATVQSTGATPIQKEISSLSNTDFTRSIIIILAAIFILLILMLQSIIAPLYIILSLAATYFITMGIVQTIFVTILHKAGISWPVPFFVFLLLVALGVDYCIFLMSRFEEEFKQGVPAEQAIYSSMRSMGNVIFSAALIMAGTFGSMTVSGVTSLTEIAISIVIGLFVYTSVILGFFIPASISLFGQAHGWPFDKRLKAGKPIIEQGNQSVSS